MTEELPGLDITIEEVIEYIDCPAKYDYRFNRKIDRTLQGYKNVSLNPRTLEESFDKEIHKIAYHIFNYVQDGKYPSEYILRKKWGDTWCKDKTIQELLYEPTGEHTRHYAKRLEGHGTKAISKMQPRFKDNPGTPLLVGKRLTVKIGRHRLNVLIDLVREIDGRIEIIDFKTGILMKTKMDMQSLHIHVEKDLAVTAASYALKKQTGIKADSIIYYDMVNDRSINTRRSDKDYKTLEYILNKMELAMNAEIYYPVMSERCYRCPFQKDCRDDVWREGR